MKLSGGLLIARILKRYNVDYLFTLCGGHISPILVGCEEEGIKVIDVRDEANAVFAADAIARLTGTVGVAAVTAGPGIANAITAMKNAQMAETPLILLGGATATVLKGRASLQDIDEINLVKTVVKKTYSINQVKKIIPTFEKAFRVSQNGVPGPVFIELPIDLLYPEGVVYSLYGIKPDLENMTFRQKLLQFYLKYNANKLFKKAFENQEIVVRPPNVYKISQKKIKAVCKFLSASHKPVLIISSQSVNNPHILEDLISAIEHLKIPVYLTSMARGLLGKNHPLHIMHKRRNALKNADLVILAGVVKDFRLDYGRQINPRAKIVSINLDKEKLRKNKSIRKSKISIVGHPGIYLIKISEKFQENSDFSEWLKTRRKLNDERNKEINSLANMIPDKYINPLKIAKAIEEIIDENSILINDGGDFISTISYIVQPRKPLSWLDPGPFGTLGSGGGFALAAKSIDKKKEVWIFYGDGSTAYSINEFDTMIRHELPVIAIIGNDASWQQVAREQVEVYGTPVGTVLNYSHYEKIVEIYGGKGFLVDDESQLIQVLKKAKKLSKQGYPVVINVLMGKSDFRKGSISV